MLTRSLSVDCVLLRWWAPRFVGGGCRGGLSLAGGCVFSDAASRVAGCVGEVSLWRGGSPIDGIGCSLSSSLLYVPIFAVDPSRGVCRGSAQYYVIW